MSVLSHFTKTYTTHSGVDITALFDDFQIMTMQGIAVSITREKVPIYIIGRARPVSISRGKRGIAGTLQFVLFDRDALYTLMQSIDHYYYAHSDEVNWLTNTVNMANYQAEVGNANQAIVDRGTTVDPADSGVGQATVAKSERTPAEYMDQIYPFDITLIAQNEYGQGSFSAVLGCEIINEGGGISMDDLTNETQATYIALHRVPWTPLDAVDRSSDASAYWASNVRLSSTGDLYAPQGTGTPTPVP